MGEVGSGYTEQPWGLTLGQMPMKSALKVALDAWRANRMTREKPKRSDSAATFRADFARRVT
jgi:hypothetical protein